MVTLTQESLALQTGGWAQGQPPSLGTDLAAKKSQASKSGWEGQNSALRFVELY